ncbi:fimbrial protein [Rouxiella sp. WC2420]|uniref:Fimbrial protein n=1 Tax=Rouxiella sp. WC2420 TaxID=3234145 RepID=A0AB39VLI3_9GAMM
MKNFLHNIIFLISTLFSMNAFAMHCTADVGTYIYDYTTSIMSSANTIGFSTPWITHYSGGRYRLAGGCTNQTTYYSGLPSGSMTLSSREGDGTNWYNLADNDYLQVAVQIGVFNRFSGSNPFNNVPFIDVSDNCSQFCPWSSITSSGSRVNIKLRIKKKFVGPSFIVNEPIAYVYGNQGGPGLGPGQPLAQINLNATMTVPQSCTINAGTVVEFNFGNISAQSFAVAGAGQKPSNANTLEKSIGIACNDISAQTTMTLRLEASNVSGNAVVSNNPDVGFILANSAGTPLTPNNTHSVIPFRLDDNSRANISLESWPISVTGNQPAAGPVTAIGYLRIDFQ